MPPASSKPITAPVTAFGLVLGVIFAGLWSWLLAGLQGKPVDEVLLPFGLLAGLCFGMSMSLFGAWLLQATTICVPFENRVDFLFRMNEAAALIGYEPGLRGDASIVYRPRARIRGTSPLVVDFDGRSAVIAGPQFHLLRLRRHFVR